MILAFASHTAHETFAHRIGARRTIWNLHNLNPARFRLPIKLNSKLAILIANQIFWSKTLGCGCAQFLRHPFRSGVARDSEMNYGPRTEFDQEKDEGLVQKQIHDRQKIAAPHFMRMILPKPAGRFG